jgi:hypothetical protein
VEGVAGKWFAEYIGIVGLAWDVYKVHDATSNCLPDSVISASMVFLLEDGRGNCGVKHYTVVVPEEEGRSIDWDSKHP